MQQVFIAKSPELADELAFERKLFVIRKLAHTAIRAANVDVHWYVASISARTLA
jgi:glutamate synthase (ferredoxin)